MNQTMQALARATDVRLARARLKAEIAAGWTTVADLLAEPEPDLEPVLKNWPVFDMLQAQPRWGPIIARRCFDALAKSGHPMGETRTVGQLTFRQRAAIVAYLEPIA